MFRTAVRLAVAALTAAVIFGAASTAFAAPISWQSVDVTLQTSDQKQTEVVVSGTLPEGASLPFAGELAVPAGSRLRWIGEILGGPVAQDPSLPYTKTTVNGMDVYRFTLTKARVAQFEGDIDGVRTFTGTAYSTAIVWTASQAVPEVHLRERLPQGAQVTQPAEGAGIVAAESGVSYYTGTFKKLKAGQKVDLTFSYSVPVELVSAQGSPVPSGSSDVLIAVILTLVVVGFVAIFAGAWHRMSRRTASREPAPVKARPRASAPETESESEIEPPAKPQRRSTKAETAAAKKAEEAERIRAAKKFKPTVAIAVFAVVLIAGSIGALSLATATPIIDGKITKFFGATSPCNSVSIPVTPNGGVDLSSKGKAIVDAFTGSEGVGDVTLDVDRSVIDVGFCESSQSEESVRKILESTGLITLGAAAPSAPKTSAQGEAVLAASGKKQEAGVDTASGTFSPGTIVLKSGVPTEITFGQAAGCMSEVVFANLGIRQSLEGGPVKVKIPALEPGTYAFACGMDMQRGNLVVQ